MTSAILPFLIIYLCNTKLFRQILFKTNNKSVNSDIFDDIIYYGGYKNEKIKDLKNLTYKKMLDVKNKIDIYNKAVVKIINNQ